MIAMRSRKKNWLTVQQTAAELDSTSAEICRLLKLRRLTGKKQKDPRRAGKAQWLVNPVSIAAERRRHPERWRKVRPRLMLY
jgi:hypothetical protein